MLQALMKIHRDLFAVGVDFYLPNLKDSIRTVPKASLILADATHLPVRDDVTDIVVSSQFFEHVHDVRKALREQLRISKRTGSVVIQQASFFSIITLVNLLILYPLKTRGRRGGIKWLRNRHKVMSDSYYKLPAKDEDVRSIIWWRRFAESEARLVEIYCPLSKILNVSNFYAKVLLSIFSKGITIVLSKA